MTAETETSILIPLYNEAETIFRVVEDIKNAMADRDDVEIVVVDDGSKDDLDREKLTGAVDTLIRHPENQGYGAALKTAIRHARGENLVIIDADGTYPTEEIPGLLKRLKEADMVVGARTGEEVHIPFIRQPAKFVLARLADFLAETRIPDLNSGLRAFKKKDVLHYLGLLPKGFSLTTTLTLAYLCDDRIVEYVRINYHKRVAGKSKIDPIKDTIGILQTIVRTIVYFNPLKVCFPLSLILGALAVVVLGVSALFMERVMDGTVAVLTLSAVQVLVIGLLADLIVRRVGK